MLEKNADVNCCFLCSVIFIEYYSTMHCNEVLQACQVDPIYCDIFGAAERLLRYGLPINLRYIFKRVPALIWTLLTTFRPLTLTVTTTMTKYSSVFLFSRNWLLLVEGSTVGDKSDLFGLRGPTFLQTNDSPSAQTSTSGEKCCIRVFCNKLYFFGFYLGSMILSW